MHWQRIALMFQSGIQNLQDCFEIHLAVQNIQIYATPMFLQRWISYTYLQTQTLTFLHYVN